MTAIFSLTTHGTVFGVQLIKSLLLVPSEMWPEYCNRAKSSKCNYI